MSRQTIPREAVLAVIPMSFRLTLFPVKVNLCTISKQEPSDIFYPNNCPKKRFEHDKRILPYIGEISQFFDVGRIEREQIAAGQIVQFGERFAIEECEERIVVGEK